jgi:hypothetical protein
MNANREKSSSVLGLVVSFLLHAIFLAGCYALDASDAVKNSTGENPATHVNSVEKSDPAHPKS